MPSSTFGRVRICSRAEGPYFGSGCPTFGRASAPARLLIKFGGVCFGLYGPKVPTSEGYSSAAVARVTVSKFRWPTDLSKWSSQGWAQDGVAEQVPQFTVALLKYVGVDLQCHGRISLTEPPGHRPYVRSRGDGGRRCKVTQLMEVSGQSHGVSDPVVGSCETVREAWLSTVGAPGQNERIGAKGNTNLFGVEFLV